MIVPTMGESTKIDPVSNEPERYCSNCGYALRGLSPATPRCPECGRAFDPADAKTYRQRPLRRWGRHVKRAAFAIAALLLILIAVWGWFFWGWYEERQVLTALRVDPDRALVGYTPILTSWPKEHLGSLAFVFDRVTTLNLAGREDLPDITPLNRLKKLEALGLSFTHTRDITRLSQFPNLRFLDLDGNPITDLTPLAKCLKLEVLRLDYTAPNNLAALAGLTNLRELSLQDASRLPFAGRAMDLAPLARLTKLKFLYLGNTSAKDLTPLSGLTELESLHLENTPVTDLTPLASLTKLGSLELSGTHVTDVAPLVRLKSLRYVGLPLTTFNDADVETLRGQLPDCEFMRRW